MRKEPAMNTFGVLRIGNFIKSRYYANAQSAIESLTKDYSDINTHRKAVGSIRLLDEKGKLFYNAKLDKKGDTHIFKNVFFNSNSFIMDKEFNKIELAFLKTSEKEVKRVAQNLKKKAIEFKNLEQDEFNKKMKKVSDVIVIKKHNDSKVDINGWTLFKKIAKPRDPGKVTYERLDERILKVYHQGNELLAKLDECLEQDSNAVNVNKHFSDATCNMDAQKFVSSLVRMVMVHTDKNEDVKAYLADKNLTLTAEISEFTNGIITCGETDNSINFVSKTGKEENVCYTNGSRDKFKQELVLTVTKLVTNAAISSRTREQISSLVDIDSLEDLAYN
jgi:hypothetical protein